MDESFVEFVNKTQQDIKSLQEQCNELTAALVSSTKLFESLVSHVEQQDKRIKELSERVRCNL